MEIIDLETGYEELYCQCLEDWSPEMKEAGSGKREWLERKKEQGLRVKLAREEDRIVGMIQYIPIEFAPVRGSDLYYIYCIWIHGYREGVGNYQGRGIGTALLEAAEADARKRGAAGMAAWGIILPFFMRSRWFRKHGYVRADRDGITELVWKPFLEGAMPPVLLRQKKKPSPPSKDRVTVTCFRNGWCPAQNITAERITRISGEHPDTVVLQTVDSENRENLEEWGICDAVFVNGKKLQYGPPPSYDKLKRIIEARIKKLSR